MPKIWRISDQPIWTLFRTLYLAVMTNIVPSSEIEGIVGASRHPTDHIARAVSAEHALRVDGSELLLVVYILHSQACLESCGNLRNCSFSLALDRGIAGIWPEDQPIVVDIVGGRLVPAS